MKWNCSRQKKKKSKTSTILHKITNLCKAIFRYYLYNIIIGYTLNIQHIISFKIKTHVEINPYKI